MKSRGPRGPYRVKQTWQERFWSKVERREEGCWGWRGAHHDFGYGAFGVRRGEVWAAHRLAYTLLVGPIPPGMSVLHHCDNPPCCRLDHLFLGTQHDNMMDMSAKGRNWRQRKAP